MNKENKYYLFLIDEEYDDDTLYAYTDSKKMRKMFISSRNMNIFTEKKIYLDTQEISYLAREKKSKMLYKYEFILGKVSIKIPVTFIEKVTIENCANKLINNLYYRESYYELIDQYLFKSKYNKLIRDTLFLTDYPEFYRPDFLSIFIHFYGKTLDFKGEYLI